MTQFLISKVWDSNSTSLVRIKCVGFAELLEQCWICSKFYKSISYYFLYITSFTWFISMHSFSLLLLQQLYGYLYFLKDFIYLFLEREEGRRKRGREISVCGCLSRAPYWGPGLKPRLEPWLAVELATLLFAARAQSTELHQPWLYGYL